MIATTFKRSPSNLRDAGPARAGKPKTIHDPVHAGMMAIWAVAASPIISRRPASSTVAKPAATPTAQEISSAPIRIRPTKP